MTDKRDPKEISQLRGQLKAKKRADSTRKRYAKRLEQESINAEIKLAREMKRYL